jgi:hypothetical protein
MNHHRAEMNAISFQLIFDMSYIDAAPSLLADPVLSGSTAARGNRHAHRFVRSSSGFRDRRRYQAANVYHRDTFCSTDKWSSPVDP